MTIERGNDMLTLDGIGAIDAARTPGKWTVSTDIHDDRPGTNEVCDLVNDTWIITNGDLASFEHDAAFIAMTSTGVPLLCGMVHEARTALAAKDEEIARLKSALDAVKAEVEIAGDGGMVNGIDIVRAMASTIDTVP